MRSIPKPIPLLLLCAALAAGRPVAARVRGADFRIDPGDPAMSEAEKSLAGADAGEHAIVLVDDTWRRDITFAEAEVEHHFRAKILTNEGRDLANVEIPAVKDYTSVKKWWGRTILPDGKVLELTQDDLQKQKLLETGTIELQAIKAALPGVVPGAVIDYGYVLRTVPDFFDRVAIQRPYRVLSMRYRWQPNEFLTASFRLAHGEGREVKVDRDSQTVVVTATNVPALREEPLMPPVSEVQTSVYFYYTLPDDSRDDYWGWQAKSIEFLVGSFNRSKSAIREAIQGMDLPPGDPLETRVEKAYDWLTANVRRSDLRSSEEVEASGEDEKDSADKAKRVLLDREGTARDLDYLFVGIARELGAEAYVAYAPDRTRNYWDPALRTLHQFGGSVVVVRAPGTPLTDAKVCDPGSGLPYGDVPWYFTGVPAFVVLEKKAESLQIPPSAPGKNVSSTLGEVAFEEGNEVLVAKWSRTGKGQHGLDERRYLRDLPPTDRADRLRDLCGQGEGTEVTASRAPGIEEAYGPLLLECESEREQDAIQDTIARYSLSIGGPWFEPVPEIFDETRTFPVVFRYPRADLASIVFSPPEGFAAGDVPAPIVYHGPFGDYTLAFERSGDGVKVSRSFVLRALGVPPQHYPALKSFLTDVRRADLTAVEFRRAGGRP